MDHKSKQYWRSTIKQQLLHKYEYCLFEAELDPSKPLLSDFGQIKRLIAVMQISEKLLANKMTFVREY